MPAEPTKAKLKSRASRKNLEESRFDGSRELELKRNRGEVSCAECRRLKIKCDKQIPCQSCQRRGCAALCPNGSLATGQGTRFVLAATEHLHRRIAQLSGRIRQLQDALSLLHSKHSSETHPLLHEDLIHVDERDGEVDAVGKEGLLQAPQTDALDAFGTLSISEHGISRFFGPTGGSESLLLANLDSEHASPETIHTPDSATDNMSPSAIGDLSLFSHSFPFTPMGQPADVQALIESHLPPYDRTLSLCETYFTQVSWIFRGVTHSQVVDDMLPVIYRSKPAPPGEDYSGPHDLALVFVILAIGALVGSEPSNALGEHFHQISRVAISLQPVLEKPSIVTIQTLHIMSIYNAMSGSDLKSETSMEMTWSLVTLAAHLSQTIGLHRDSARWGLTPKMVQRRRVLFWDLFVADVWQSLNTGRPPSFSLAYIDCSYPHYGDENGFSFSFKAWHCRFTAECVADVAARTLTAEAPSYTTIMELDRKVRDFPFPDGISNSPNDLGASFQRCILDHVREIVLMYIHRSFFAQAIIEHPVNPLKSIYAPSFLAAYRASSTILKSIKEQFNTWPNSSSRFWTMWTSAFSAAVVFGTVVTRGPRSPLAQPAMAELEQACILFTKAAVYSTRAAKALPILKRLSDKAHYALAAAQRDPSPTSSDNGGMLWTIKQEDTEDELSIFAGHTRFVSTKRGVDSSNTCPPYSVPFAENSPVYSNSSHKPLPHSEAQPVIISGPGDQADVYSCYEARTSLRSSPNVTPIETWNSTVNLQSPIQYMSSSPSNVQYSYAISEESYRDSPSTDSSNEVYNYSSGSHAYHHPIQEGLPERYRGSHPDRQELHQHYATHASPVDVHSSHYAPQYPTQNESQSHAHGHVDAHHSVAQHLPSSSSQQHPPHQPPYTMYSNGGVVPYYHPHPQTGGALPNMDLADLGLASRDSRLDERWTSFMADSGLLEDFRAQ